MSLLSETTQSFAIAAYCLWLLLHETSGVCVEIAEDSDQSGLALKTSAKFFFLASFCLRYAWNLRAELTISFRAFVRSSRVYFSEVRKRPALTPKASPNVLNSFSGT